MALLKVDAPDSPIGTIILTTGGVGANYYEEDFVYGDDLITDLNAAGYTTVQVAWETGWSIGSGGPARLACRYATLARWIYTQLHQSSTDLPFCATGQSGGSSAVAYGLTRYGLDKWLDAVVLSGGPPHARLDLGCDCIQGADVTSVPCGSSNLCYSSGRVTSIDAGYEDSPCEGSCVDVLMADSVVTQGVDLAYPDTTLVAIFGSLDPSNSVAQAMQWYDEVTTPVEINCIPETGHPVAATLQGYQAIRDELILSCNFER